MTTKRAWKLQEFVGHASKVNCLALGHKSGRVMVTGGDDKKVNMWAVGKPNCILSLSGHTSQVEAVHFDNAEEMVCAGSLSGALKIWDLEHAKIVRTLTSHKSNIRSLDFHPYGEFVASGSLDTNIKLWDIRRKGCIFTYKGHTNCVNSLRFSPDGRWIASAGEDGLVKLWDLTAGKLLTDFKAHVGPVNSVEFHPNEFLLSSGGNDRTIKFWDLEKFDLVSSSDGESSAVRSILYHPEGLCMYSGAVDMLKVYSWEPAVCHDSVAMGWSKVADMAITQNQLIGASFQGTNVSTYIVDIQRVQPIGSLPGSPQAMSPPATASGRRSFTVERPATQSSRQAPKQKASKPKEQHPVESVSVDDQEEDGSSFADIKDPDDYRAIFQPKKILAREPTSKKVEPFPAPKEEGRNNNPSFRPETDHGRSVNVPTPVRSVAPSVEKPATPVAVPAVPKPSDKPSGLDMDDFLPKQVPPHISQQAISSDMSEAEALSSIVKGHNSMMTVTASRKRNLQIVRAMWTSDSIRTAVDCALGMHDQAVMVDLLNIITQKASMWNLDLCAALLPTLRDLLSSKYDNYTQTSQKSLKLILRNFAPVIKSNVVAPPSIGVDICREERYRKCKLCYDGLMEVRSVIDTKSTVQGPLAFRYRELQLLLGQLD